MRRTILGLTALLAISGTLLIDEVEAGRRRKCCNPCQINSCSAPQTTCCMPQATCCAPQPPCCVPLPYGGPTCLRMQMFTLMFGNPGTCFYAADCYSDGTCPTPPTTCSWDGDCGQSVTQVCPSCNPRLDGNQRCRSLTNKIQFTSADDEKQRLYMQGNDSVTIIASGFATFTPLKQASSSTAATANPVVVRLLVLQWIDPRNPSAPKVFPIGYEVDRATSNLPGSIQPVPFDQGAPTDACRKVHHGMDYDVRLCLSTP